MIDIIIIRGRDGPKENRFEDGVSSRMTSGARVPPSPPPKKKLVKDFYVPLKTMGRNLQPSSLVASNFIMSRNSHDPLQFYLCSGI